MIKKNKKNNKIIKNNNQFQLLINLKLMMIIVIKMNIKNQNLKNKLKVLQK